MKFYKYSYILVSMILGLIAWGCAEDTIEPMLAELRNQSYDLVVISSGSQHVPVSFSAQGSDLEEVTVNITAQGGTEVVATNTLRNITADKLNRVSFNVPFPSNDVAPTGIYTVSYSMNGSGEAATGSYDINVINNVNPVYCDYTDGLPSGTSVWIRLYVPEGADLPEDDDNIYLTGSFGTREGGSDWDGGGDGASPFVFDQLDDTCYELAINLESGDNFKITRGNWGKEMATATGSIPGNFVYNGESEITITAYNWADRETVVPETAEAETLAVPAGAIQPGMLTFVAELNGPDANDGTYYVVEKGAANLDNAWEMIPFEEENMVAAAVPKSEVEYIVVKGEASAIGTNAYGFEQSATWDGHTNPVQVTVGTFEGATFTLGDKIVIVGSASPGDWGASSGQDFTKTGDGTYEITIALNADAEYLLLPDYGQWGDKWAYGSGDALSGTFDVQGNGPNLSTAGIEAGTYTISVDFTEGNGTYQLSGQ